MHRHVTLARRVLRRPIPLWVALAGFLATVGLLSHRAIDRREIPGRPSGERWTMTDFRDTIYYPVVAVLAGRNPYAASFADDYPVQRPLPPYGPLVILVHFPLGLLPVRAAEVVYYLLTLALTLAVAALGLRACDVACDASSVLALATLMLLSRPGHQNLLLGQCTLEVVLGCYLALVYGRRRPWLAVLGVALATMKPQFAAPLALLLLARGEFRTTVGGLAAAGVLSIATLVAVGGRAALASWPEAIARSSRTVTDPSLLWLRIDAGFFARYTLGLPAASDVAVAAALLLLGIAAFRRATAATSGTVPHGLDASLACVTILVAVYHVSYDALLLTLPLIALAAQRPEWVWRRHPRLRSLLFALLLVPAVNYVATSGVVQKLETYGVPWRLVTGINGAALIAALLLSAALARSPERAVAGSR